MVTNEPRSRSDCEFHPADPRPHEDSDLATFFLKMFRIDVDGDVSKVQFPTFEEVLGLTDLAILRKEAFRHFDRTGH
jgi:hypothetical protein